MLHGSLVLHEFAGWEGRMLDPSHACTFGLPCSIGMAWIPFWYL